MNPIVKYFNGEKAESYLFIILGIIALAMALYFFLILKTSFWKGVALPFFTVALLEVVVGYTIVTRSPNDKARVENYVKFEPQQISGVEIPRMEKVMHNFVVYRYVEIFLILSGMAMMYSTTTDTFWRGLGLGLFIKASIVLSLDFFAERRGHVYVEYLKVSAQKK